MSIDAIDSDDRKEMPKVYFKKISEKELNTINKLTEEYLAKGGTVKVYKNDTEEYEEVKYLS